jgi:hypothetical protein
MKKAVIVLFLVSMSLVLAGSRFFISGARAEPPPQNADMRVSYFYNSLLPYGNWMWHARYGWCWYPYNVSVDWRPYSEGYWAYTDYGWTWVSNYPWGWACFHYGRWFYDDSYGWLWWPDTVWAPSWVVWRTGGDWIGWAPCPPEAAWSSEAGLMFPFGEFDVFFTSRSFCFVRRRFFLDRDLGHRIEMRARNVSLMERTEMTRDNLRSVDNRIVNRLPVHEELEKQLGHPIERLTIAQAESPSRSGMEGKKVMLFRPELRKEEAQITTFVEPQAARKAPVELFPGERVINRAPPEMVDRHAAEMRALEQVQKDRQRQLETLHNQEISNTRDEAQRQQLMLEHQRESSAQSELMQQERRLMQTWHGREEQMVTAPQAPPQRRFDLSTQSSGSEGSGGKSEGVGQSVGERRHR